MKDAYGKEVNVGDKVMYIHKSYGYRSLSSVYLCCGMINKVTEKTVVVSSVQLVNNDLIIDNSYQTKITYPSDSIIVVDEFPKQFIDCLKKRNSN